LSVETHDVGLSQVGVPKPRSHGHLVPAPPVRRRLRWQLAYISALVLIDGLAFLVAGEVAIRVRFGSLEALIGSLAYREALVAAAPLWLACVAFSRGYSVHLIGHGTVEYRRVIDATVRFCAVVAMVAFAFHVEVARWVAAVGLPLTCLLTLVLRWCARHALGAARARGAAMYRVLVIGDDATVFPLAARLAGSPQQGYDVVGVCLPRGADRRSVAETMPVNERRRRQLELPVLGDLDDVRRLAASAEVDVIAVAPSAAITAERLRQLAWDVEGEGVEMLVAPALTDVAGPRIHIRPVEGQPLLHVRTPQLSGSSVVIKAAFDRVLALIGIIVTAPVMLLAAIVVRSDSAGPALFRQVRVGKGGRPFTVYKFRSMHVDAHARVESLWTQNAHCSGPLFKIADDPRLTRVGRVLRRWSVDELPQLFNVLFGHMSLVGPRPPLPSEVDRYERSHVYRRLLVKPGLTGLWQVSGRSDLDWSESVRLDLYYVENWSLAFDMGILGRTVGAVLRGRGAY
jgi:exopolysaccharide biosynthesis polyprenyl glycosylphosphotransferase